MKLFKFGADEDGDVVFCVAGLVSFTEYRGAVLVSWGDETRYARKTPDSWAIALEALVLFCWRQAAEGDLMYGSGGDGRYQKHALNEIEQRTREIARALLEQKP